MKRMYFITLIFGVLCLMMAGCQNDKKTGEVTTEVVNNPASAQGNADAGTLPVMQFDKTEHDFGQIIQGEKVSISFKFKNTGKSDLVIASANASCGCTVPDYPKQPVKPGEEGRIEVVFSSANKRGFQNQRVSIVANTQPNTTVLTIKANVVTPEN